MRCHICDSILEPKEIKLKDGKLEPCFECKFHIYTTLDTLTSFEEHIQVWERRQEDYDDYRKK